MRVKNERISDSVHLRFQLLNDRDHAHDESLDWNYLRDGDVEQCYVQEGSYKRSTSIKMKNIS